MTIYHSHPFEVSTTGTRFAVSRSDDVSSQYLGGSRWWEPSRLDPVLISGCRRRSAAGDWTGGRGVAPGRHLAQTATVTVNLLGWGQRALADAFAGVAPAPGGPFALADWGDTEWGPVLMNSLGWIRARLRPDPDRAGWGLLFRAVVERVEIQANPADELLCYVRGRYRALISSLGASVLGA